MLKWSTIFLSSALLAQAPESFSYQAVARNIATGLPLVSFTSSARFMLHQGSVAGTVVYSENHDITTNDQGLFTLKVGSGTPLSGTFNSIDWGQGPYYLETSLDLENTGSFTSLGTQQLLSVPYALYAKTSGDQATLERLRTLLYLSSGF